jgi:chromosomal replication initiation ATPase DnaA
MQIRAKSQLTTARGITRAAITKIKNSTGMRVTLVLCPTDHPAKTPEQMLYVVSTALKMDYSSYRKKSRKREYVDLRFIAAHLLRFYFPTITLQQISLLFGGQDHSSVINGLAKTNMLLATKDDAFTEKYETASKSVNQWLRKEVLGYASAISA